MTDEQIKRLEEESRKRQELEIERKREEELRRINEQKEREEQRIRNDDVRDYGRPTDGRPEKDD